MNNTGSGIGRNSATAERDERAQIFENYAKKAETFGRFPGTHTLGGEFKSIAKVK